MKIEKFNPCIDGLEWYNEQPDFKTAWQTCERGDWMLWMAAMLEVDKRKLTLAKGKCAETAIHLMKDQRSKDAVKAAIDYGNGLINDEELAATADAAYAAAADANAAIDAAADAYAAAAAAADAADAAAAYAAAAADAGKEILLKCADICREVLTGEVMKLIND